MALIRASNRANLFFGEALRLTPSRHRVV